MNIIIEFLEAFVVAKKKLPLVLVVVLAVASMGYALHSENLANHEEIQKNRESTADQIRTIEGKLAVTAADQDRRWDAMDKNIARIDTNVQEIRSILLNRTVQSSP